MKCAWGSDGCGERAVRGSYCAEHAGRMYLPAAKRVIRLPREKSATLMHGFDTPSQTLSLAEIEHAAGLDRPRITDDTPHTMKD